MEKYTQLWLDYNNISSDFHRKQFEYVEDSIKTAFYATTLTSLQMYITDMVTLEAVLPAIANYSFRVSRPDKETGFRILEVYK